jgi:Na+/H+-dicarboxylate symporter
LVDPITAFYHSSIMRSSFIVSTLFALFVAQAMGIPLDMPMPMAVSLL